MIFSMILLLTIPAGAPPTNWADVDGAPLVRYRWSRPAANSCLVELQNNNANQIIQLSVAADYLANRPVPAVQATGPLLRKGNATVVRPRVEQHSFRAKLNRLDRSATAFEDCYGIVHIRATITSIPQDLAPPNPDTQLSGQKPGDEHKPLK